MTLRRHPKRLDPHDPQCRSNVACPARSPPKKQDSGLSWLPNTHPGDANTRWGRPGSAKHPGLARKRNPRRPHRVKHHRTRTDSCPTHGRMLRMPPLGRIRVRVDATHPPVKPHPHPKCDIPTGRYKPHPYTGGDVTTWVGRWPHGWGRGPTGGDPTRTMRMDADARSNRGRKSE